MARCISAELALRAMPSLRAKRARQQHRTRLLKKRRESDINDCFQCHGTLCDPHMGSFLFGTAVWM